MFRQVTRLKVGVGCSRIVRHHTTSFGAVALRRQVVKYYVSTNDSSTKECGVFGDKNEIATPLESATYTHTMHARAHRRRR